VRAAIAGAVIGDQLLAGRDGERHAGGAERAQRGDLRGPGGDLLLAGAQLGHAGGLVRVPQRGGELAGDQAVHGRDVGGRVLVVGEGVVGHGEPHRHRGGSGQVLLGEGQPGVDVHVTGGRRRRAGRRSGPGRRGRGGRPARGGRGGRLRA